MKKIGVVNMDEIKEAKASCATSVSERGAVAKRTLVHYFSMISKAAGIELGSDCLTEIEGAVDDIVESAVLDVPRKTAPNPREASLLILEIEKRKLADAELTALAALVQADAASEGGSARDRLRAELERRGVLESSR